MDAVACEAQFLDHAAPIWRALPERGRLLIDKALASRAQRLGLDYDPIDAMAVRQTPQQPPRFDGQPCLVASIGDIKVARRLGYGPFVFLEHGAGQWYGQANDNTLAAYSGGPDHEDVGLFLVPNETIAGRWRARYPDARVAIVGCPKIDTLPQKQPDLFLKGPIVAVSWHWPAPLSIGDGLAGTAWNDYREALPALAKAFHVIGHQHPNWIQRGSVDSPSRTYAELGIPFVPDFEEVCRIADVYVCDNSSTIWEFAATGRPVVLLNGKGWTRSRGKVDWPPRFWSEADVGINVDRPADLVAAVEEALLRADMSAWTPAPGSESARWNAWDREAAVNRVYGMRTNGAATAAEAIGAWLAARTEVAA